MAGQRDASKVDGASALVLDGGRATRLGGAHKAFLPVDGEPMAHRTLRALRAVVDDVMVATTRRGPWAGLEVRFVEDVLPGAGPLSGIAAALAAARTPCVLVVAGDMPHVSAAICAHLARRALAAGRPVAPVVAGRVEPLCAAYLARDAEAAREALAAGVRRPADFLARAGFLPATEDELAPLPGFATAFRNVNSPADLESGV